MIELEKHQDDRGFFARTFCEREFREHGLEARIVQCNASFNKRRGTLRGFHWQIETKAETKIVRVTRGAIFDVIVDLRPGSATRLQYFAIELSDQKGSMLYIPAGFAHGFQTLVDDTEIFYQMSEFFAPEYARGARWNDPAFAVKWPVADPIMNERDRSWPDFEKKT